MLTGRSHPGHVHPQSRTLSALRCAPEIVRLARPTSITVESEPRMMRVTAQSHAILSTALAEIGSENSMFAPGAPGSPSNVSREAVTCRCARCGTADLVEVTADEDRAVVAVRQLEAARLHALSFFGGAALGVGRVASVVAVVMKASNGVLASLPQQRGLIETLAHSG